VRLAILLLGLLVTGCGRPPADQRLQGMPSTDPAVSLTPVPLDLVVLHTNDNWGETEPCG
jgi:hypothetical protein